MKFVIDSSIAKHWYLPHQVTAKAFDLRQAYFQKLHELLAPDIFHAECTHMLVQAEKAGVIPVGRMQDELIDLQLLALPIHPSFPLLARAGEIALTTKLNVMASVYVALAEREQCSLLTANQSVIRNARKHFNFVVDFATLP